MSPNFQIPRIRATTPETANSRAPGPPALWRKWPALLERAARARGNGVTTATPCSWAGRLARRVSNAEFWSRGVVRSNAPASPPARLALLGRLEQALIGWSERVERHPARMFGVGAAFAF